MVGLKWRVAAAALGSCLALGACGDQSPETQQSGNISLASSDVPSEGESAKGGVASTACAALHAPAGPTSETFLNLTFGMSIEEVKQRLSCTEPEYQFQESRLDFRVVPDAPSVGVRRLVAKYFTLGSPLDRVSDEVTVTFADAAGVTKLIKIDRMVRYGENKRPLWSAFRSDVERNYPGISFDKPNSVSQVGLLVQTPNGQRLDRENKLYSSCIDTGAWQHKLNVSPLCGLAVGFELQPDGGADGTSLGFVQSTFSKPAYTLAAMKGASAALATSLGQYEQSVRDADRNSVNGAENTRFKTESASSRAQSVVSEHQSSSHADMVSTNPDAQEVVNLCSANVYQKAYFNCQCLGNEFQRWRTKRGKSAPAHEIWDTITNSADVNPACANTENIYRETVGFCEGYIRNRRLPPKIVRDYCSCVGNRTAQEFRKAPRLSSQYVFALRNNALKVCE